MLKRNGINDGHGATVKIYPIYGYKTASSPKPGFFPKRAFFQKQLVLSISSIKSGIKDVPHMQEHIGALEFSKKLVEDGEYEKSARSLSPVADAIYKKANPLLDPAESTLETFFHVNRILSVQADVFMLEAIIGKNKADELKIPVSGYEFRVHDGKLSSIYPGLVDAFRSAIIAAEEVRLSLEMHLGILKRQKDLVFKMFRVSYSMENKTDHLQPGIRQMIGEPGLLKVMGKIVAATESVVSMVSDSNRMSENLANMLPRDATCDVLVSKVCYGRSLSDWEKDLERAIYEMGRAPKKREYALKGYEL